MKEKQLSYRFNQFNISHPFVGHYLILSSAIRGMKYSKGKVTEAFDKYVPKSDYSQNDRDALLENLWGVSMDSKPNFLPKISNV